MSFTEHGEGESPAETHITSGEVLQNLNEVIISPCLSRARALESALIKAGYDRIVFGRFNQRSSIEANAESDRGIAERLANAFDASLTAARVSVGQHKSERSLTPRNAAQRFFCPNPDKCAWEAQDNRFENIKPPVIQFWEEDPKEKQRYRKFHPEDGLATVLVRDFGVGLHRDEMPRTILELNSDAKLRTFEAIGQFGHGGSSSLFFCESALIITQPRLGSREDEVYWTLVYPERDPEDSKQELVRRWFGDSNGLPLVVRAADLPAEMKDALPGVSVWHFGYRRGGWIKRIAGPEQTNPWGRLGRLFFSYPLPFEIHGVLARADATGYARTITSPFHRLREASNDQAKVQYFAPEKRELLLVEGVEYGEFSFVAFVLPESKDVRNYVDARHPVVLTLNGQDHGEMTRTVLVNANLPELSSSMIVEVRLDGLEQEALSHIITNSREFPKPTPFTAAMTQRLTDLLREDEALQQIERKRQDEKAKQSNRELNDSLSRFIKEILSDALGAPTPRRGGGGTGGGGNGGDGGKPRPEVPPQDPPKVLEFLSETPMEVLEGVTRLGKFKSDARPPKYAFGGDNPRLFAKFEPVGEFGNRVSVVGYAEINSRGYGSVSLYCAENVENPIRTVEPAGRLELRLQSTDGNVLVAVVEVRVGPKPERKERQKRLDIQVEVVFCAPDGDPDGKYATLIVEETVSSFGNYLNKFKEALPDVSPVDCTYWGEKYEKDGVSALFVEINVANPSFTKLLEGCGTLGERIVVKERYCRDVVLDCYQHCFHLQDVPDEVWGSIEGQDDEAKKASEIYLNHDKAIRFAALEKGNARPTGRE